MRKGLSCDFLVVRPATVLDDFLYGVRLAGEPELGVFFPGELGGLFGLDLPLCELMGVSKVSCLGWLAVVGEGGAILIWIEGLLASYLGPLEDDEKLLEISFSSLTSPGYLSFGESPSSRFCTIEAIFFRLGPSPTGLNTTVVFFRFWPPTPLKPQSSTSDVPLVHNFFFFFLSKIWSNFWF